MCCSKRRSIASYRLQIILVGTPVRAFETSEPALIYPLADQIADFGAPPAEVQVKCTQNSPRFGAGRVRDPVLRL
jgi:hypothetical protein